MPKNRYTIYLNETLRTAVEKHTAESGETLTHFYNMAILNQLERVYDDLDLRYEVEEEINAEC